MTDNFDCLYSVYPDVFSRYFFKDILQKVLFDYDYTLFYADFRELGHANHVLGVEKTDKLIGNSLKIAMDVLPDNTCTRIAGDEFLFLVPTSKIEKDSSLYIKEINNKLISLTVNDITPYMDFVCVNGKKGTYLGKKFEEANVIMDKIKLKEKYDHLFEFNYDNKIEVDICNSLKLLFNNFRVSQIKDVNRLNDISKAFKETLEDVYDNFDTYLEKLKLNQQINLVNQNDSTEENGKLYSELYKAICNNDNSFYENNREFCSKINGQLVKNDVSNYYNKLYYQNVFSKEHENDRYQGLYLELYGLKTLNTIYGHDNTDEILKRIYMIVSLDLQKSDFVCFDFLSAKCLLLSKNKTIDNERVKNCVDYLNNDVLDKLKLNISYYPIISEDGYTPKQMYYLTQLYDITNGDKKDENRQKIVSNYGGKMVSTLMFENVFKRLKTNYSTADAKRMIEEVVDDEIMKAKKNLLNTKSIKK